MYECDGGLGCAGWFQPEFIGNMIRPVKHQIGHHRGDPRGHAKADLEPAIGDKMARPPRIGAQNRRAGSAAGAQSGPGGNSEPANQKERAVQLLGMR